jgi:hypothetical protein
MSKSTGKLQAYLQTLDLAFQHFRSLTLKINGKNVMTQGVDLIKLFWCKFTNTFL